MKMKSMTVMKMRMKAIPMKIDSDTSVKYIYFVYAKFLYAFMIHLHRIHVKTDMFCAFYHCNGKTYDFSCIKSEKKS